MKKLILAISLALPLISGCGKDVVHEQLSTPPSALTSAPTKANNQSNTAACQQDDGMIGFYSGYLIAKNGGIVPFSLKLDPQRVSDTGTNALHLTMRIGLFGGVQMGSVSASYNISTQEVSAMFNTSTESSLEFKGKFACGIVSKGTLTGSQRSNGSSAGPTAGTGTGAGAQKSGNVLHAVLAKNGVDLFDEATDTLDTNYEVSFPDFSKDSRGILSFTNRVNESLASNRFSDLPYIPNLWGGLRFKGIAMTSNAADLVEYDPLNGVIDMNFGTNAKIEFTNVFLPTTDKITVPLAGTIYQGSSKVGKVTAKPVADNTNTLASEIRGDPRYYVGTLTGSSTHLQNRAVANLVYAGGQVTNPNENIFLQFPSMILTVDICNGSSIYQQMVFNAISINPVTGRTVFREAKGNVNFDFEANYGGALTSMSGTLITPKSAYGKNGVPSKLSLKAISGKSWHECGS